MKKSLKLNALIKSSHKNRIDIDDYKNAIHYTYY